MGKPVEFYKEILLFLKDMKKLKKMKRKGNTSIIGFTHVITF